MRVYETLDDAPRLKIENLINIICSRYSSQFIFVVAFIFGEFYLVLYCCFKSLENYSKIIFKKPASTGKVHGEVITHWIHEDAALS